MTDFDSSSSSLLQWELKPLCHFPEVLLYLGVSVLGMGDFLTGGFRYSCGIKEANFESNDGSSVEGLDPLEGPSMLGWELHCFVAG